MVPPSLPSKPAPPAPWQCCHPSCWSPVDCQINLSEITDSCLQPKHTNMAGPCQSSAQTRRSLWRVVMPGWNTKKKGNAKKEENKNRNTTATTRAAAVEVKIAPECKLLRIFPFLFQIALQIAAIWKLSTAYQALSTFTTHFCEISTENFSSSNWQTSVFCLHGPHTHRHLHTEYVFLFTHTHTHLYRGKQGARRTLCCAARRIRNFADNGKGNRRKPIAKKREENKKLEKVFDWA